MLTKDMLEFRRRGEYLKIKFIDPKSPENLKLSNSLLLIYTQGAQRHCTRGELDEMLEPIIKNPYGNEKLARGLNKLISDHCEFTQPGTENYAQQRSQLFQISAEIIKKGNFDPHSYTKEIAGHAAWENHLLPADIYLDLPENEIISRAPNYYANELLNRYNVSLVQSLLLYANELDLTLADAAASKLRKVFKYLKFFRLLSLISPVKSSSAKYRQKTVMNLKISGPASLFENTRKYGLQLASFFPAICELQHWKLSAEIKINNRIGKLSLDEKSELVSSYNNFSSYIPEEITMFHHLFKSSVQEWQIVGETPFLPAENNSVIFPDLCFQNTVNGQVFFLELFHRYHRHELTKRLEYLNANTALAQQSIIGIDSSLVKKDNQQELLEKYPVLQKHIFFFRDFPGVERVKNLLNTLYNK